MEKSHRIVRDRLKILLKMNHKAGRRNWINEILVALDFEEEIVRRELK